MTSKWYKSMLDIPNRFKYIVNGSDYSEAEILVNDYDDNSDVEIIMNSTCLGLSAHALSIYMCALVQAHTWHACMHTITHTHIHVKGFFTASCICGMVCQSLKLGFF